MKTCDYITLSLTPAEHAFLLLKLGRGTGSTIRPGESLSAEEVLRLVDKVERALEDANNAIMWPVELDAAHIESPDIDEWLPIESAPRDGTHVLLADETFPGVVAFWHKGGWNDGKLQWVDAFTHWRHLPQPPATT